MCDRYLLGVRDVCAKGHDEQQPSFFSTGRAGVEAVYNVTGKRNVATIPASYIVKVFIRL